MDVPNSYLPRILELAQEAIEKSGKQRIDGSILFDVMCNFGFSQWLELQERMILMSLETSEEIDEQLGREIKRIALNSVFPQLTKQVLDLQMTTQPASQEREVFTIIQDTQTQLPEDLLQAASM